MSARTVEIAGRPVVITTDYWAKPIPTRNCDWCATDDNYEAGDPIGYGATEEEAVADLIEKLTDAADEVRS